MLGAIRPESRFRGWLRWVPWFHVSRLCRETYLEHARNTDRLSTVQGVAGRGKQVNRPSAVGFMRLRRSCRPEGTMGRLARPEGHAACTRAGTMRPIAAPALPAFVAAFVGLLSALSILTFSSTSLASLAPVDLALGKPATQSSTLYGSDASLAVDGNTDGDWNDGSVTYTGADVNSWWEVDLGQSRQIGSIEIFNRTDCCMDAISPFVVLVSDGPIIDNDIVASGAEAFPGIMRTEISYAYMNYSIPINRSGRYVRIALLEQNNLSLAEVKVFEAFNAALGRTATQSSTLTKGSEANRAVDGNVSGALANGVDASTKSQTNPWWEVDLGLPSFVNGLNIWSAFSTATSRPGFYVFTSLTPFTSDPLVSLPPGVTKTFINAQGAPAAASIGAKAQYIRIEISGTASLSLAEVQVWLPARGAIGSHAILSSLGNSFTNPNGATDFYSGAQGTDPLTAYQTDPYLELDLGGERYIDTIKVWGITLNSNSSTFSLFVSTVPFTSTTVAGTRAQGTPTEWVLRGTTEDTTAAVMQRGRFAVSLCSRARACSSASRKWRSRRPKGRSRRRTTPNRSTSARKAT